MNDSFLCKEVNISVIIPMYNAEKTIERCISSVIRQNRMDVEIILIDDGSDDKTVSIVKQMRVGGKQILLFEQEHKGVSAARNYGIKEASGKWISFLDADDELLPNAIDIFMASIDLDIDAACGTVTRGHRKACDSEVVRCFTREDKEKLFNYVLTEPTERLTCHAWFFKKTVIDYNKIMFSPVLSIGEDSEWVLRFLNLCGTVKFLFIPLYRMNIMYSSSTNRQTTNQLNRYEDTLYHIESTPISKKRQWPVFVLITFLLILTHVVFHPQNTESIKKKIRKAKEIRHIKIFNSAFSKADYSTVSIIKRIVLLCAKKDMWCLVYFAVLVRQKQNKYISAT